MADDCERETIELPGLTVSVVDYNDGEVSINVLTKDADGNHADRPISVALNGSVFGRKAPGRRSVFADTAPASPLVANEVIFQQKGDDTRSGWRWFITADGDLIFGCFPRGELYESIGEQVAKDFASAVNQRGVLMAPMPMGTVAYGEPGKQPSDFKPWEP